MSLHDHKADHFSDARVAVMTVSDTRTVDNDKSGQLIREALLKHDYSKIDYFIVKDDKADIHQAVTLCLEKGNSILLINGGTGIAKRDVTIEVVEQCLEKELPGFGELFRMLSYTEDIGSAAILSRAIAGTIGETAIFSMPGSTGAVRLAMEKLILPELNHILHELKK